MADDPKSPPSGRLARFGKLAKLSARVSTGLAARAAAKVVGADPDEAERKATEHVVQTLGELKGAAMKLGQALSMDADALPPELRAVMARLQNQAPPVAFEEIERVLVAELGGPIADHFADLERTPIAAASLGQVHRATLPDGRRVAVKVQYPGMAQAIESDFANLGLVVSALSRTSKVLDGRAYYDEFRREVALETDYLREAQLATRYRELVAPFPDLVVPEVIGTHSKARVLTLEFVEGITLNTFAASDADNAARLRVSDQLVRAIYAPFLSAGEVHADPHPGNFLVTPDGKLAILDFGSVKAFSAPFVDACRRFYGNAFQGVHIDAVKIVREAGFTVDLSDDDARALLAEIQAIASRPVQGDFYDYGADTASRDMRGLAARRRLDLLKLRPPPEGLMFARAIGGCAQNLRVLGARGDFRAIFGQLVKLVP